MSVHRALLVAQREFLEHVRTRGFWWSLGTIPLLLLISLSIPLLTEASKPVLTFAVSDRSGWVLEEIIRRADARDYAALLSMSPDAAEPTEIRDLREHHSRLPASDQGDLAERLARTPESGVEADFAVWWTTLEPAQVATLLPRSWRADFKLVHAPGVWIPRDRLAALLRGSHVFATLAIPADPVGRTDHPASPVYYTSDNLTNVDLRNWFSQQLAEVLRDTRRDEAGIDAGLQAWILERPSVEIRTLGGGDQPDERAASTADVLEQWGPVLFVYILWFSIILVTQMLMTSTVEEKANKLIEVLLVTLEPVELMAGKILGIAATGMVLVSAWLGAFMLAAIGLPTLLGAPSAFDLTPLATNPAYLVGFIVYFVLGYLFYAALLCGLGSLCNSLKEAQTLAIPVQGMLFIPLITMLPIGRDPSGTLANVLSWIPPFTPFVMLNRAAEPPSITVYIGTTVLMLVSIAGALWLGARLFRAGVLMTGNPPNLRALLRLVLRPASAVQTTPRHSANAGEYG